MDMEFSLIHEPNSSIIKFASISKAHPLQWDSWMSSSKEIDPRVLCILCHASMRGGHDLRFICDAFARCKTIKLKRCFTPPMDL